MKAVILAAGKGKRLRPLTSHIAKAMLPFKGKPIIGELIRRLEILKPEEIRVVIGWRGNQIREYLGDYTEKGTPIRYVTQKKPEGTARAIHLAVKGIKGDVIVSACDSLFPEEHLVDLCSYHFAEKCDATLSLKIMNRKRIISSSSVKIERDGSISEIVEKPALHEVMSNYASSPLYVFRDVVKDYLPKVKKSKRGEYEIQDAIQLMINEGLRVKGVVSDRWVHLSTIEDFLKLNYDYLQRWLPRED